MPSTIERCLARLGLALASLAGCDDLDAEWAAVKRAYFKTALKTHPDKGGDASAFRKVLGLGLGVEVGLGLGLGSGLGLGLVFGLGLGFGLARSARCSAPSTRTRTRARA